MVGTEVKRDGNGGRNEICGTAITVLVPVQVYIQPIRQGFSVFILSQLFRNQCYYVAMKG